MMSITDKKRLAAKVILGLTTASLYCCSATAVWAAIDAGALPTSGTVTSGTAEIATETGSVPVMNITQTTDKAIINWGSFNIGSNAAVNFVHTKNGVQNTAGITLNRVAAAGGMSEIYGKLNAVGSVILVNPNGVLLGSGGEVNAAGIVMSTADISDADFNNGKYIFEQNKNQNNNIVINGTLNASTNGDYLADINNPLNQKLTALKIGDRQAATGFSMANNKIMLIADGDIAVGSQGRLQATTTTNVQSTGTVGQEGFSVEGDALVRTGSVVLRADQNADDVAAIVTLPDSTDNILGTAGITQSVIEGAGAYTKTSANITTNRVNGTDTAAEFKTAKVYLNNDNAAQIQGNAVSAYFDADIVNGVLGTTTASLGITGAADTNFTQKNNAAGSTEAGNLKNKVAQSGLSTYTNAAGTAANTAGTAAITDQTYAMLVNNVYQLEAIQDTAAVASKANEALAAGKDHYYGNLSGTYALGTTINAAQTANWTEGGSAVGFNPIGNGGTNDTAFTGGFSGHGGSNTYGIYDLTINRQTEDNVGLFASTNGASIWSASLIDANISGKDNVGGFVGSADKTRFSGVTMRKRNLASDGSTVAENKKAAVNVAGVNNVGGIVGQAANSSVRYGTNGGYVQGTGNNIGGIAGEAAGHYTGDSLYTNTVLGSVNQGYYSAAENIASGIKYGVVEGSTAVGGLAGSLTNGSLTESYSNGQVSGTTDAGGLAGAISNTSIIKSYNTNEASTLGGAVQSAAVGAGTSVYGKVTGNTNVGGAVGSMSGSSTVDTVYNAGNITGSVNVGGIAGKMSGTSAVSHAYNADNNTVLQTEADGAAYYGFVYGSDTYTYDQAKQNWLKNGSTVMSTAEVLEAAPESGRLYNNRLAYRDAVITGDTNTGGVVGYLENGSLNQTYNAGAVKSADTATAGAVAGKADVDIAAGDNFYVTNQNHTGTNLSNLNTAVGSTSCTNAGITAKTQYQAQNISSNAAGGVTWTGTKNQDANWMVYTNSAAPLLKYFMSWININRQYEYDGTVHNLMTADVANYYGGSFFTGGKGQNVYTDGYNPVTNYNAADWVIKSGSASSETKYSSVYKYDNSNMWSPQHGYYTDAEASVIITPKNVTADLSGTKTYGEIKQGYLYKDNNNNYWQYDSADSSWINQGVTAPTGNYYVLTLTDLAAADTGKAATDVFANLDKLILSSKTSGTTSTSDEVVYGGTTAADQQIGAGTYNLTVKSSAADADAVKTVAAGTDYDSHNYNVKYTGKLTVEKADLVVNINGERVYGAANNDAGAQYTYTAAGVNTTAAADLDSTNGQLKSWDKNAAVNVDNGKTNTLNSEYIAALTADTGETITHNGTGYGSQAILDKTDVKWNTDTSTAEAYRLGSATFTNASKNVLANYKIVFDTSRGSSSVSTMKITPRNLTYDIAGSNTYGQTNYQYTSSGLTGLASGTGGGSWSDVIGDVLTEDIDDTECDRVGEASRVLAGINTDANNPTHVAHNNDGEIVNVVTRQAITLEGDPLAVSSSNHNYAALNTTLTYKVNPAEISYQVADNTKQYGNTSLDNASSGYLVGTDGNALDMNTLYTGAKANVTALEQTDYSVNPDYSSLATIVSDAAFAVKRNANTEAAGKYENVVDADKTKFYLNDYAVTDVRKGGVTITPKDLTITAGDAVKTYGQTNAQAQLADNVFSGLIAADAALANVGGQKISDSIGQYTDTGHYAGKVDYTLDNEAAVLRNYNVTKQQGSVDINRKGITYTVNNAEREYGADNPTFSGSFAGVPEDDAAEKITAPMGQNVYTLNSSDSSSDVGTYTSEIGAATGTNIGKNYRIDAVNKGDLTITQGNFYYKASPVIFTEGDTKIDTAILTGTVVNSSGKDMTSLLTADDSAALAFASPATSQTVSGDYRIFGSGVANNTNYRMAVDPQLLANNYAFHIKPQVTLNVNDFASIKNSFVRLENQFVFNLLVPVSENGAVLPTTLLTDNGNKHVNDGGHVREEGRGAIRFLTIRDTGINLTAARGAENAVTIDKSSRVDGGETITVKTSEKSQSEITDEKTV